MRKGRSTTKKSYTVMLVPSDGAKVRSFGLSAFKAKALGFPAFCLVAAVAVLACMQLFNPGSGSGGLDTLNAGLDARGAGLVTTDSATEPSPAPSGGAILEEGPVPLGEFPDAADPDASALQGQVEELERRLVELYAQSEAIGIMRTDIVNVFDELSALGLPFSYDETMPDGVTYAVGGNETDSSAVSAEEMVGIAAGLEAALSREAGEMQVMADYARKLAELFKVRPTGWPVNERGIVSGFGYRINPVTNLSFSNHEGVDIDTPYGAEVYATAYGVVRTAEWNDGGYGYLVVIDHEYDYSTWYAHNSELLVAEGDEVEQGQLIALAGSTGRSTGPHCHYEVRINDVPQDPGKYLGEEGGSDD